MSEEILEKLDIPPSYDIGVPPHFYNMLKGNPYLDAFWRAHASFADDAYVSYYQEKEKYPDKKFNYDDIPQVTAYGMREAAKDSAIDEKLIDYMCSYINDLAIDTDGQINFLRFKEFLAYCGIEGVYDLENRRHFKVQAPSRKIVDCLDPAWWQNHGDVEDNQLRIAMMMDVKGEIAALEKKRRNLPIPNSNGRNEQLDALYAQKEKELNRPLSGDEMEATFQEFISQHEDLLAHDQAKAQLLIDIENKIQQLKDEFAPLDREIPMPKLGIKHDKEWYKKSIPLMTNFIPYAKRYEAYMEEQGVPRGHEDHIDFSWDDLQHRAYAVEDYALREFVMNENNRGEYQETRRLQIPRNFVETVLFEMDDNLLQICKPPHRIERIEGKPEHFRMIMNNAEVGEFTLDHVLELEATFEENKDDPFAFRRTIAENQRKYRSHPTFRLNAPNPENEFTITGEEYLANMDFYNAHIDKTIAAIAEADRLESEARAKKLAEPLVIPQAGIDRLPDLVKNNTRTSAQVAWSTLPHIMAAAQQQSLAATTTSENNESAWEPVEEPLVYSPKVSHQIEGTALHKPSSPADDVENNAVDLPGMSEGSGDDYIPDMPTASSESASDNIAVNFGQPNQISTPTAPKESAKQLPAPTQEGKKSTAVLSDEQRKKLAEDRAAFFSEQEKERQQKPQEPPAPQQTGIGGGLFGFRDSLSGIKNGTKNAVKSILPSSPKVTGQQASARLYEASDRLADLRDNLTTLTDVDGNPMMPDQVAQSWQEMNEVLSEMQSATKMAERVKAPAEVAQVKSAVEDAMDELKQTKPLLDKSAKLPGKVGELANQAKAKAEALAKAITQLINAILRLLGIKTNDKTSQIGDPNN